MERGAHTEPDGVGSEAAVAEILWDLADGTGELPDADQDGVALGPTGVLEAMAAMTREPGAYPSVSTFLRFLVRTERVPFADLKRVLIVGGHPHGLLPENNVSEWPTDLRLPATRTGRIDSVSNPAPSGGPPHHGNGMDAVRVYRFFLDAAADVEIDMKILGDGTPDAHQDVDVELRSIRADLIDASRGTGPTEHIQRRLERVGTWCTSAMAGMERRRATSFR